MNQHVKRFFAALFCAALCLPLIGMSTGLAQAQTQSRDMLENLSELQVSPDPETSLWLSVAYTGNPAELEYYLEQYPDGEYVEIANRKLDYFDYNFRQSESDRGIRSMKNYLESYPDGRYAELTMERIAQWKSSYWWQMIGVLIVIVMTFGVAVLALNLTQRAHDQT